MLIVNPQTLASYIREQRKAQGLSQQALADLVGLRQATVSAFENAPENASLKTFFKFLAALRLDWHLERRDLTQATDDR